MGMSTFDEDSTWKRWSWKNDESLYSYMMWAPIVSLFLGKQTITQKYSTTYMRFTSFKCCPHNILHAWHGCMRRRQCIQWQISVSLHIHMSLWMLPHMPYTFLFPHGCGQIQSQCGKYQWIFHGILSVPPNIVMNMNNVFFSETEGQFPTPKWIKSKKNTPSPRGGGTPRA